MNAAQRFEAYMEHLAEGLGHADRHAGLKGYCTGLTLPLERKKCHLCVYVPVCRPEGN